MPTTYIGAPQTIHDMAADIIREFYPELKEAEVTLLIQLAHAARNDSGEPAGPAVRHHGYPAAAVVSIVPLKDRAAGLPDARIVLDGDQWTDWPTNRQRAILDHEIHHLELVVDDDGNLIADDIGRPKLKLRKHDFEVGGFDVIMQRHREFSMETEFAAGLARKLVQMELPWG